MAVYAPIRAFLTSQHQEHGWDKDDNFYIYIMFHHLPLQVMEAMSADATADDDAARRRRRSRSLEPTDTDSGSDDDSEAEQGGAVKVPLAAALEAAAEPSAGRCLCPATSSSILVSSLTVAHVLACCAAEKSCWVGLYLSSMSQQRSTPKRDAYGVLLHLMLRRLLSTVWLHTRRKSALLAAGQVVPRVDVQNKHLKGLLMMDQYPWMVKLLDGRTVSPSEFERLAGSLRKNWKSSTMVLQVIYPPYPEVWPGKSSSQKCSRARLTGPAGNLSSCS